MKGVLKRILPLVLVLGLALVGSAGCAASGEAPYPSKDVTLLIPWAGGGNVDLVARIVIEPAKKALGRDIVVKNLEGGAGTVGTAEAAKAKPDGYTVFDCSSSPMVTVPHLQTVPYKYSDFIGVLRLSTSPIVVVVKGDAPYKSLKEYVEASKAKALTYGTPGEGGTNHLAGVKLAKVSGANLKAVPFKSTAEAVTAVIGGHADSAMAEPGPSIQHIREGRLRALAVLEDTRFEGLPDVATAKELGYDAVVGSWTGIALQKGASSTIVTKVHDAFKKGMDDPAFKEALAKIGQKHSYLGSADFEKLWAKEYDMYGELMAEVGLKKTK